MVLGNGGSMFFVNTWVLINPRRPCAARVTVGVCACVCVSTLILVLQATRWPMSDTNGLGTTGTLKLIRRFS